MPKVSIRIQRLRERQARRDAEKSTSQRAGRHERLGPIVTHSVSERPYLKPIGEYTVSEIMRLSRNLPLSFLEVWLYMEKKGKNRKTVISYLRREMEKRLES